MPLDDMSTERSIYDNIRFCIDTPEGKANIIIAEEKPGVIYKIFFHIGKAGSINNAWSYALAEMVVSNLQRGASLSDIIADLSNITSSRPIYDTTGIPCRSGPEALYLALLRYRNLYRDVSSKPSVTHRSDYRPASFGHNG